MRVQATVIAVNDNFAIVETERTSACEGCHKAENGGCSVCSLMGGSRKISARAENKLGAKCGDRVMIESKTGRMMWYAMLVFLLPIILAIGGYLIAAALTNAVLWQTLGAAIGFCGTFLGVFAYSKYIQKKRCDIEIVEILDGTASI